MNKNLSFDFFTKQDVKISINKKNKSQYKVKMLTNNPLLFYQVWNKRGLNNNTRYADEMTINNFVKEFLEYNLKYYIKYTPTTVIDFGTPLHILVLVNVEIDNKGKTIFYFEKNSVEIKNKLQPIDSTLPLGKFKNIRFDIDGLAGCSATKCRFV